jgi:hypothetical protein
LTEPLTVGPGDRVVLTGQIMDVREGFALVQIDGAQPRSAAIAVVYEAMALAQLPEPPTLGAT